MDEVDIIIIRTLKSIGCELDDAIKSLDQMNAEVVVEATATCIGLIDSSIDIHKRLPPNMAARYRIGTDLAGTVKNLGYQGEVGYHTFLYSNETELRKIFLFLIGKLPKRHSDIQQETPSTQALLKRSIKDEIMKRSKESWVPMFVTQNSSKCNSFESHQLLIPYEAVNKQALKINDNQQAIQRYYSHYLPLLVKQLEKKQYLYSSILESNSLKLALECDWMDTPHSSIISTTKDKKVQERNVVKDEILSKLKKEFRGIFCEGVQKVRTASSSAMLLSGRLTATRAELTTNSIKEENLDSLVLEDKTKDKDDLECLENKVKDLLLQVDEVEYEINLFRSRIEQMNERKKVVSEDNKKKKELTSCKKKINDLLPDAERNIKLFQEINEATEWRIEKLKKKYKKHHEELTDDYTRLSHKHQINDDELKCLLEELTDVRWNIKEFTSRAIDKETLHQQLMKDYERKKDGLGRASYTHRILEIVANIKKQNQEIDKVIEDTKWVQKEINQLSGVVERTFIDADELIFKNAKRDETARKAYKLLASLHENCSSLVKSVEEIGLILRETSDLEEQFEVESCVKVSESLENILNDYQQIKQENKTLLVQIKAKSSS